jgi:sugar lactone lactonase YvrE
MKHLFLSMVVLRFISGGAFAQDIPLAKILVEKEGWREVAKGWPDVTFLEAESAGGVAFFQGKLGRGKLSGRIDANGQAKKTPEKESEWVWNHAVVVGPAGRYFFTSADGKETSLALASPNKKAVLLKLPGLFPSCMTMWPDEGHLVIGEATGAYLWAVRIEADGSFGPFDRYYSLRTKPNETMHVTALVMDAGYLLYACTPLGIQVFDPTGRLSGVIAAPSKEPMTAITIGGAKADELFVAAGNKIFARKIQGKASYTLKK